MSIFTRTWTRKTDIPLKLFVKRLTAGKSTFHTWINRWNKADEHNALIPRDFLRVDSAAIWLYNIR